MGGGVAIGGFEEELREEAAASEFEQEGDVGGRARGGAAGDVGGPEEAAEQVGRGAFPDREVFGAARPQPAEDFVGEVGQAPGVTCPAFQR